MRNLLVVASFLILSAGATMVVTRAADKPANLAEDQPQNEAAAASDRICVVPVRNLAAIAVPPERLTESLLSWLNRKKLTAVGLTTPAGNFSGPSEQQRKQAAELGCNAILLARILVVTTLANPNAGRLPSVGMRAAGGTQKVTGRYSLYAPEELHSADFEYSDAGPGTRVAEDSMRAVADSVKSFLESRRRKKP